jgi:hypothetical protein
VQVPQSFCLDGSRQREFLFSELALVPGFFSQKAFQLGVESDVGERTSGGPTQEYQLRYEIATGKNLYFDLATGMLQDKFQQPRNRAYELVTLVKSINDFFESTKPMDVAGLPFFLDWVDLGWNVAAAVEEEEEETMGMDQPEEEEAQEVEEAPAEGEAAPAEGEAAEGEAAQGEGAPAQPTEPEQERRKRETEDNEPAPHLEPGTPEYFRYYVTGIAESYYDQEFSDAEHFNALPASARTLPGINNFAIPKVVADIDSLRLRIHIAPMTAVLFSNNLLLEDLGFTEKTYGRKVGRRFVIKNSNPDGYITLEAENAPKPFVFPTIPTTFFCAPIREVHLSPFVSLSVTQTNFKSNNELLQLLEAALGILNTWTNLSVAVSYNAEEKKFVFTFPTTRVSVKLHIDSRLAERLGYGLVQTITHNSVPNAASFNESTIDVGGLSRALVWDTVMSAVTLENATSISAYGFDGPLMATLWPEEPGIMRTRSQENIVRIPTVQSGQAFVPLTFKVWSLGKNSSVSPLQWPVHCFVAGILKGR